MKLLYCAIACLLLSVQVTGKEIDQKAHPVEFRVTTLSNTISPTTPAKFEVALINRSSANVWISHRWLFEYFSKDSSGEHMLNYLMREIMAPTKDDFVRLCPSEGIIYQTQITWNMLPEQDRKPGKKTFVIKVWGEPGNNAGIDAWTGELSAKVELNVLKN